MTASMRRRARARAAGRCEYCRISDGVDDAVFHVDHVLARQHGGKTRFDNLAYCCSSCNLHKGPNLSGFDRVTRAVVRLFQPRTQRWEDHFKYAVSRLIGLSPTGRATIATLGINLPINLAKRQLLILEGEF